MFIIDSSRRYVTIFYMCKRPFWNKEHKFWCPCGHCAYCKLSRVQEWITRLMNEYNYWQGMCSMVTLTYSDDFLPKDFNLCHEDVQKLFMRLRTYSKLRFKYFIGGEYGPNGTQRPHYHIIFFGISIEDAEYWFKEKDIWGKGFVDVGYSFNAACCAYTAGYCLKKLRNKEYPEGVIPPYVLCSQGIGRQYAIDHCQTLIEQGYIMMNKYKKSIPRYYWKVLEKSQYFYLAMHSGCVFPDKPRQKYYEDAINLHTEGLIADAEDEGVTVFSDWEGLSPALVNSLRKEALLHGRVVKLHGIWRFVTQAYHEYCLSVRDKINKECQDRINKKKRDKVA